MSGEASVVAVLAVPGSARPLAAADDVLLESESGRRHGEPPPPGNQLCESGPDFYLFLSKQKSGSDSHEVRFSEYFWVSFRETGSVRRMPISKE
jgi:hypothetical protein